MSWVLLTGRHAYKLKKPVNLGYVDYTSLEKRFYYCTRELELNSRLCPDAYLEVVPVTRTSGGFCLAGPGEVIDYAVKMKRLPPDRMLDYFLVNGSVTVEMIQQVACRIAGFHQQADTNKEISSFGSQEAVSFNAIENFEQIKQYTGTIVEPGTVRVVRYFTESFLKQNSGLLQKRQQSGYIRDCHGDLHSAHICFNEGLCIYDCIEFNDRFRYSDTASEVAFLAMDLERYGRADLACGFVDAYIEMSGDADLTRLIRFYKAYRAMVRAKVNCFKTEDPYVGSLEKFKAARDSAVYFDLARSATLEKPVLIINVGLVGSGKTSFARELACRMGLVVISSDIVRKTLAGIPPVQPYHGETNTGIYSPEFSRLTYSEMFSQADTWLKKGVSVILDATFIRADCRLKAFETALKNNADFIIAEHIVDDDEACRRIAERMKEPGNVSDARPEVYFKMKQQFEALNETEQCQRVIIDSMQPVELNLARVQHFIYSGKEKSNHA